MNCERSYICTIFAIGKDSEICFYIKAVHNVHLYLMFFLSEQYGGKLPKFSNMNQFEAFTFVVYKAYGC